ncbi:hypothetical protein BDY24DRAFT_379734 [Mrakia frigida]|uniref:uncharacterized protein n=1 Tax=Mrakia frigida TaxID=29902 RepID=UPI003FCC2597
MAGKSKAKVRPAPKEPASSQGSSGSEDAVVSFETFLAEVKANEFRRQRKRVKDALASMQKEKASLETKHESVRSGRLKGFEDLYTAFLADVKADSEDLVSIQKELCELERNFVKFVVDLEVQQSTAAKKWDVSVAATSKGLLDLQEAERKYAEVQVGVVLNRGASKSKAVLTA